VSGERSDADLVEGVRAGDESAWTELVERYTGRLWATARAQGLSTELASDVVQTTWLALLDGVSELRKAESIRFWLTTVARHEAIRVSRRQRRLGDDVPLPYLADASATIERERVETLDQVGAMRIAMTRLSERCRELLHLLFSDEEFSYREIADLLGRPIGSLGAQRARCLDQLRELLDAA
jgi:RNA polymerase sigma factor (sigma-70 family)